MKNVKEYVKKVNIYTKNYKVTSNRNVNKETNKRNKEKIYKNNKYIEICIKIYKQIYNYENIQIYRNESKKHLCENIKESVKTE